MKSSFVVSLALKEVMLEHGTRLVRRCDHAILAEAADRCGMTERQVFDALKHSPLFEQTYAQRSWGKTGFRIVNAYYLKEENNA